MHYLSSVWIRLPCSVRSEVVYCVIILYLCQEFTQSSICVSTVLRQNITFTGSSLIDFPINLIKTRCFWHRYMRVFPALFIFSRFNTIILCRLYYLYFIVGVFRLLLILISHKIVPAFLWSINIMYFSYMLWEVL